MSYRDDKNSYKTYSKFSDVSSSHSTNSRGDMNDPKCPEEKNYTDEYYDSGVISETCEIFYSESDIKNEPVVSEDNISGPDSIGDKGTKEDSYTDSAIDMKTRSDMNLDSGFISEANIHCSSKSISFECEKEIPKKDTELQRTISWEKLYAQDDDGNTSLHYAIKWGNETVIKYIVFNTPSSELLDIQNNNAETCLHLSALTNQPRITRFLLLAGAKPNIEDRNGNTALHVACKMNNLKCVEALCDRITGFDKNYYRFKYIAEPIPAEDYINEINYDGLSCLHIATNNKELFILSKLMLAGANINAKELKGGQTVLHVAVVAGSVDLVKCILQHPYINIEQTDYSRYTAYQLSWSHPEISEILLEKQAINLDFVEYILEDESSDESDSDEEYSHTSNDSSLNNFINVRSEVVV